MTMTVGSTAGGAVYDRGYRPYQGPVGGRWSARWALFRLTARRALGIRRSWRQRVLPWSLLALATMPALVNVGIRFATRDTPADELEIEFITYRDYLEVSMSLLLFVAVIAPDALCPDRRNRTLPLIFSRPLTGVDYVLAKVAALVTLIFGFAFFPQVVLFTGQTFVHEDGALDYVRENAEVLWQVPLAVAGVACLLGVFGLAVSSLTSRRIVGGVAILGFTLVSGAVAGMLVFTTTEDGGRSARVEYEPREVPPPEPGPGGPVGSLEPGDPVPPGVTVYEDGVPPSGERFEPPGEDPRFEEEWDTEHDRPGFPNEEELEQEEANGSAFALIDVLNTPLYLRDVIFLGHIDPESELGGVDGGAVMALVVYLVVLSLSLAVLLWRYREVQL